MLSCCGISKATVLKRIAVDGLLRRACIHRLMIATVESRI